MDDFAAHGQADLRAACAVAPICAVQQEWSAAAHPPHSPHRTHTKFTSDTPKKILLSKVCKKQNIVEPRANARRSLLTRNAEELLIPACKELGVGFVAYSPLARNLLAATV